MEKLELGTTDLTQDNIGLIGELFPQVITEALNENGELKRVVDFDALKQELSGETVEGQRERYQFTWPGKQAAKLEARRPINKTLRPRRDESVDFDTTENLYIEGDNLDALKLLRNTYAGKIKMIYIDPPYNTGNDFIYDDDYSESAAVYSEHSGDYNEDGGQLVTNLSSNGRFHSDWCSMMYPRLLLAKDLLTSDGVIFISIDDGEATQLRKICDEVFGEKCFVGDISWQRTYSPRNDAKGIPKEVEHIITYSKSGGWIPQRLERTVDMNAAYQAPDDDEILWASGDAAAAGGATHQGMVYAIQHPFTGRLFYPPSGSHWRIGQPELLNIMNEWAPYELRELDDASERARLCGIGKKDVRQGVKGVVLTVSEEEAREAALERYKRGKWPLLYFTSEGTGGIRRKRYLDESQGRIVTNYWPYSEVGHTDEAKKRLKSLFDGSAPFDTPKPVRLISRMIDIATDEQSTVLDFFSGSATTAEAVIQKNAQRGGSRSFILVQLAEKTTGEYQDLCEIGKERIRRAGVKIKEEAGLLGQNLDVGFRVLKTDSSNFLDNFLLPGETHQTDLFDLAGNMKFDRSPEDVLFEVLPAFRIPFSATITSQMISEKQVFNVNEGQLLACFDTDVTTEVVEEIAMQKPVYAVFRDVSFADDSAAANFEELFKTYSPDTVRKVI